MKEKDVKEFKYYDYYSIGEVLNFDVRRISNILFRLSILKKGDDPEDLVLYRKNMVDPKYIIQNKEEYELFFKESFYRGDDGYIHYKLEVTDAFLEFIKKYIVKEAK